MKRKICILVGLMAAANTASVLAAENSSPCYISSIDYSSTDFDPDANWVYNINFDSGENIAFSENDLTHTFLMINGSFENIPVEIQDGISLISASDLCVSMNASLEFNENAAIITLKDKTVKLFKDSNKAELNGTISDMPVKSKTVGDSLLVPLRYTANLLGADVMYTEKILAPFYNSVISIDDREKTISKEEALDTASVKMKQCYKTFRKNEELINYEFANPNALDEIADDISNMKCIGETASFWIIKGPYILLVDKNSGDIFVKYGSGNSGHGSYSECIMSVNINDIDFFSKDYYLG